MCVSFVAFIVLQRFMVFVVIFSLFLLQSKRKHSESHNSTSSEKQSGSVSPRDPFEEWEKAQRKQHQRDLRHNISNKLEWTHV